MVMAQTVRIPSLATVLLALSLAATGRAQAAAPAAPAAPNPVVEPAKAAPEAQPDAAPARPRHSRVMSDEVAASLATGMPKYNPPKPVEPKPEEEQADLREIDKPKNKIIRLPKYTVREPKPPVFREIDLRSRSQQADIALRQHAGLKAGNIGGLNDPIALLMYQEQDRLNSIAELNDDAQTAKRAGNTAGSDYILKESNRTYYRPSDFGWNSDGGGK